MSELDRTLEELKTLADELRLKAHLAGKDLEAFLEKQEPKVRELQAKAQGVVDEAKAHAPKVKSAFEALLAEVEKAVTDARDRLKS